MPSGGLAWLEDGTTPFRPDWHFVGVRDNLIFHFQVLPLGPTWAGTSYPRAWSALIEAFIGDVRTFLDARD
ncbi:MAG: hypothetical protein AB1492_05580 [Bacillota bacterium]